RPVAQSYQGRPSEGRDHFAIRYMPKAQRFYQKKMAKSSGAVATKALANKLTRASYFVMRDQVPFDEDMLFK
ncbi:hypothetical protein ACFLZM_07220, partial [Thermodesulfobacteriota bacterium]